MSFTAFLIMLICVVDANSKFVRKCCPENHIFENGNCQPSKNRTPTHSLLRPHFQFVYNNSCNLREYHIPLILDEETIVLHENNYSLTVTSLLPRVFHSGMYCLGFFENKPGVLVCYPEEWLKTGNLETEKDILSFGK